MLLLLFGKKYEYMFLFLCFSWIIILNKWLWWFLIGKEWCDLFDKCGIVVWLMSENFFVGLKWDVFVFIFMGNMLIY